MSIEDEVLARIIPTQEENQRINEVIENVSGKINKFVESFDFNVEPVLVGSVAKGTHLKNPDVDLFIMFPKSTKREDLESLGLKIGIEVLEEHEKRYAEHPYVSGMFNGFNVEVVPCYKIDDPSQRMSAVDRTPFHTEYIIKHINDQQRNHVRLLKQFLKGIGIYGAEAEIEGFSGYLCELLILHAGSFNNLIENAMDWKRGELITFDERKHTQFADSLIVIDPVDPNRNVASALSNENFATFIYACKEYKREPKKEFFFPNNVTPQALSALKGIMDRRGTNTIGIVFNKPDVLSDILHSQLRKAQKGVIALCERFGFKIIASDFFVHDDILFLFEFQVFTLPDVKLHKGPPVWHPNVSDFKSKWMDSQDMIKGPYIREGHWYVDIKREFRDAKQLLESKLVDLSLGGHVMGSIKSGYIIKENNELIEEAYAPFLTKFYFKKFPWEY
jgi:tRNA nucleotidyltransferase (CCA-adding enzyme)